MLTGVAAELMGEARNNAKANAQALAWPDRVGGTRVVPYADEVRIFRELALQDATYPQRKLEEMAPKVIKGPNGQTYRPIAGMLHYQKVFKDALPEVWAVHAATQEATDG
jgi:hypothetical protein